MPDRPQAILRVEPQQIPALRAAFAEAAQTMTDELAQLGRDGDFPEPWFRDPVSVNIKAVYDAMVMHGPNSAYQHLTAYRDELVRIVDNLTLMQARYDRTESDIAASWGTA